MSGASDPSRSLAPRAPPSGRGERSSDEPTARSRHRRGPRWWRLGRGSALPPYLRLVCLVVELLGLFVALRAEEELGEPVRRVERVGVLLAELLTLRLVRHFVERLGLTVAIVIIGSSSVPSCESFGGK